MRKSIMLMILLGILSPYGLAQESPDKSFYFRGTFYLDWYGVRYQGNDFFNQLSTRIKMDFLNPKNSGWTLQLDVRDRLRLSQDSDNRIILYDACLSFEKPESPLYFSAGQMNLYDTAGIGQLLGGIIGVKPISSLLIGGYAGLASNIYINRMDKDYSRFGVFARHLGSGGKRFSLSYNQVRYSGLEEKQYLYLSGLYPFKELLVLYGNLEYQLGSIVPDDDRLSRLFLNLRFDPVSFLDLGAFYSSGKGLDFHRYVLEKSKDPTFNDREIERYYYSKMYGLRFSLKPADTLRFTVSRMESEQMDANIKNHSWIFEGSALNILKTGMSAYGSYRINHGKYSESDSYDISLSKEFGRVTLNARFSNTYNTIRFESNSGNPSPIHIADYKTYSVFVFLALSRNLSFSVEYEYFLQEEANQHLAFVRLIYRKSR